MTLRRLLWFLLLPLLAGCTQQPPAASETSYGGGKLPPPVAVVVYDFLVDEPLSPDQRIAAAQAQAVVTEELATKLASFGLPVMRHPVTTPPPRAVAIQGEIVAVGRLNSKRHVREPSRIGADAQVLYVLSQQTIRLLRSIQADSNSLGKKQTTHKADNASENPVRIADALAVRIGELAVEQGWLPPGIVH